MATPSTRQPADTADAPSSLRDLFRDALGFWEPRRVVYNIALAALTIGWVLATWPHFRAAMTRASLARVLGLAALANVAYSTAYLIDLPLQQSSLRDAWRRRRWIWWWAGTLVALLGTYYWIGDEIYPYVNELG